MKLTLYYYLIAVFSIIIGVAIVIYLVWSSKFHTGRQLSSTIDSGRHIFMQKIIFLHKTTGKLRACSMDLSHCDSWYVDLFDFEPDILLASYQNVIYGFFGPALDVLIFDMYGSEPPNTHRGMDVSETRHRKSQWLPVTAVYKGYIYTAIGTNFYECAINELNRCQVVETDEKFYDLKMIKFHKEFTYVRYRSFIERCSSFTKCSNFSDADDTGSSIVLTEQYLYADAPKEKRIVRCDVDTTQCDKLYVDERIHATEYIVLGIRMFNRSVYIPTLFDNETVINWKCDADVKACEELRLDTYDFIVTYASVEMLPEYLEEELRCSWQPPDQCPAKKFAYEKNNTRLELSVSQSGYLIDASGTLFDTTSASYYRCDTANATDAIRAAIFVMDNGGSIYASNYHAPYEYQHSSLMAGKPVSSAGVFQVFDGKIKFVSSCSSHYKVPPHIAEQFLDSLLRQGYKGSVVKMEHVIYRRNRPSRASHFCGAIRIVYVCCILVVSHSVYLADLAIH